MIIKVQILMSLLLLVFLSCTGLSITASTKNYTQTKTGTTSPQHSDVQHTTEANKHRILFVHIGKTAGSTIGILLKKNNIAFSSIHVHSVRTQSASIARYIIIPVRDPISRLTSAFNWRLIPFLKSLHN